MKLSKFMKKIREVQLQRGTNSGKQWFQSLYLKAACLDGKSKCKLIIKHLEEYPSSYLTDAVKIDIVDGINYLLISMKPKLNEDDWYESGSCR